MAGTDAAVRRLRLVFVAMVTVVVLLAADARHPRPVDRDLLRVVVDHRPAGLVTIARAVSHAGDPSTLIGLAALAVAGLWWWRRSWVEALLPAVALTVGASIEATMKQVIGRARPPASMQLLHETDPSFPSGHTTGSAALFVAVAMVVAVRLGSRRARVGVLIAGGGLAAAVGAARVVLGVHWPTDIVAGWCLGVAAAVGTVLAVRRLGAWPTTVHRGDVGYPGAGGTATGHDRLPTSVGP